MVTKVALLQVINKIYFFNDPIICCVFKYSEILVHSISCFKRGPVQELTDALVLVHKSNE